MVLLAQWSKLKMENDVNIMKTLDK